MTWLKQARVLAPTEKQKEIDVKMQEVQKQASAGSLFGMAEEPAPVIPQPQGNMNGQSQPSMQTEACSRNSMTHTMNPEPVMQTAPQQIPQESPNRHMERTEHISNLLQTAPVMQGTGMPQGSDAMQPYPQTGTATVKRTYTERNGTSTERKRTGIPDCTDSP